MNRKHINTYRSGLEEKVSKQLDSLGVPYQYEKLKLAYHQAEDHKYCPDFELSNGILVETKGRFVASDRKKHLLVKAQHPKRDIRFVFQNSATKINKGSKTSYADWCTKHGFKYSDKLIPKDWVT